MLNLSWVEVKSALVYAVLSAVLATLMYVIGIGDIFKIEMKALINIGVMSLFVGITSIIKNFLTSSSGKFLGAIQVKPGE